jgi:hypothetical protein
MRFAKDKKFTRFLNIIRQRVPTQEEIDAVFDWSKCIVSTAKVREDEQAGAEVASARGLGVQQSAGLLTLAQRGGCCDTLLLRAVLGCRLPRSPRRVGLCCAPTGSHVSA